MALSCFAATHAAAATSVAIANSSPRRHAQLRCAASATRQAVCRWQCSGVHWRSAAPQCGLAGRTQQHTDAAAAILAQGRQWRRTCWMDDHGWRTNVATRHGDGAAAGAQAPASAPHGKTAQRAGRPHDRRRSAGIPPRPVSRLSMMEYTSEDMSRVDGSASATMPLECH